MWQALGVCERFVVFYYLFFIIFTFSQFSHFQFFTIFTFSIFHIFTFASNEPMTTAVQPLLKSLPKFHQRVVYYRNSHSSYPPPKNANNAWSVLEETVLQSTKSREDKKKRRPPLPTYPKRVKRLASPVSMTSVGERLNDIRCDGERDNLSHTSAVVSPSTLPHEQNTSGSTQKVGKIHPPFAHPLSSWAEVEAMCMWAEVEATLLKEGGEWEDLEYGTRNASKAE
jgi:hypothetical protein